MRRTAVVLAVAGLLLAGCSGSGDEPTVLPVVTPAASATAGAPSSSASAAAATPAGSPATGLPAPGETSAAGPASAYQVLATQWQRARGTFFTAVSQNKLRTVAEQRALASAYLTAQKRFAAGLAATDWPAGARPAVRSLLGVNSTQQANIAGMARARTSGEFTGFLGRYGVSAGPENAAVDAVAKALR